MNKIILSIVLLLVVSAKHFSTELEPNGEFCFFDVLQTSQKYSFKVYPHDHQELEGYVKYLSSGKWQDAYRKMLTNIGVIQANKIASQSTTYMFCLKNLGQIHGNYTVIYTTGLQMMEFSSLPDQTDSDNLNRELEWLQKQQNELGKRAQSMITIQQQNSMITNLLGKKFILVGIIGLLGIVGINLLFYHQVKKTFKDRKLI